MIASILSSRISFAHLIFLELPSMVNPLDCFIQKS